MRSIVVTVLLGALFVAAPALAQDNTNKTGLEIGTGFDYSAGRYGGTTDTTVLSIPLDVKFQFDRFRVLATLPYLDVRGPGTLAGGIIVGGSGPSTTRTGLGDLNLGAAWLVNKDDTSFPAIEIGGTVKIPTASTGLGTGKPDYSAMANIYHSFTPRFMLFGTAGYQWLNDFGTFHLESGVFASAGANFKPSDNTSVGISANYHQEYYQGLGDQWSLSPYALWNFDKNWRVVGCGTVGLSKASPRVGGGLRIVFFE